jgi:hypothetical protein
MIGTSFFCHNFVLPSFKNFITKFVFTFAEPDNYLQIFPTVSFTIKFLNVTNNYYVALHT